MIWIVVLTNVFAWLGILALTCYALSLDEDIEVLRAELERLRSDHEKLASWTDDNPEVIDE